MNLPVLILTAVAALTPAIWLQFYRPGAGRFLFSVRVPEGFLDSPPAARILRDFRLAIWAGALIQLVAMYTAISQRSARGVLLASLLHAAGLLWPFWWAHRRTRRFAAPAGGTLREAPLTAAAEEPLPLWIHAAPVLALAMLATATAVVSSHWDAIPDPMPLHYNLQGQPDRWGPKRWPAVYGVLPTAVATQLLLGFLLMAIAQSGRITPRRLFNLRSIAAISLAVGAMMSAIAVLPLVGARGFSPGLLWGGLAAVVAVLLSTAAKMQQADDAEDEPTRDDCWEALYYADPEDARLMVPNRMNAGYSPNFGHRAMRVAFPGLIGLILISAFLPVIAR